MFQELVFHHLKKREKRYLLLNQARYRIGKALDNDIVLLDSDAAPYVATLEKIGSSYRWCQQNASVDLQNGSHETDGYVFKIRNYQKELSAVFFGLVLWASLLFFQFVFHQEAPSKALVALPARGAYGNNDPKTVISNVRFEFQTKAGKYSILHYTPGNLEKMDDLQIEINGSFLGFAPASPGRWNVETSKYIPKDVLKESENILEFSFHGKKPQSWAIKDIYVEEVDEIPAQQSEEDYLKTIQKLLRERSVRKGNLVRAEQVVHQATEFYRQKNHAPPANLEKFSARIRSEKNQMIQDHQTLIQKYRRENEIKKSKMVFEKLMDELIDPMDPDRIRIEQEVR